MWMVQLLPLAATAFCFVYGLRHFFKRGKPLFLQSITMAMGCHSLGAVYRLCLMLTAAEVSLGFTPAYLGQIGFFLFFIAASYGQMDRILDDGSAVTRPSRFLALVAPVCAALVYIPIACVPTPAAATRVSCLVVWIPAMVSLYFLLKHAVIPDCDFGFVKAIKPYNTLVLCLEFSELLCLTAWAYYDPVLLALSTVLFGVLCICTMVAAKKGVEKWTI